MRMNGRAYAAIVDYIAAKPGLQQVTRDEKVAFFTVEGVTGINVGFVSEMNKELRYETGFLIVMLPKKSPLERNVTISSCSNPYDRTYYHNEAKFVVPCPSNFETTGINHQNAVELKSLIDTAIGEWPCFMRYLHECTDFSHTLNFIVRTQVAGSHRMSYTLEVKSNANGFVGLFKSSRELVISSEAQPDGHVKLAIPVEDEWGSTVLVDPKTISTESFVSEMTKFLQNGELRSSCYDNLEHFVDRMVRLCE